MANEVATNLPIDLTVWGSARDSFHVRKVLGLQGKGETVSALYKDNLEWARERADKLAHEESSERNCQLPFHGEAPGSREFLR